METKIRLKNITLFGFHGCDNKEKEIGQNFEIDIEIRTNIANAIKTDDIHDTIDYNEIYHKVVDIFNFCNYNLIEVLANQIVKDLLLNDQILGCKVVIRKPNAPINGQLDTVEVEIMYNV